MENKINDKIKEGYELTIWKNGKQADSCFKIKVGNDIDTISKLKELILFKKNKVNVSPDKVRLFNHKGFDL